MNVSEIERVCSVLEATDYVTNEVKRIYYQLLCKGKTQGKDLTILLGALIYYINKRDNMSILMLEISNKLERKKKLLFKRYKRLKRSLIIS
ncbi:Uncharacterised protein [Candidatus Tiddalikarchaeum anstoanum]|nr:Uncharacterised protein [Candidatus Tiddalikarchaeum anstoanum]